MTFPDRPTMHLGCVIYGFESWDDAYRAADEYTDYSPDSREEFEKWLHYLSIKFEVVSNNCGD